jgi:hypothetical protein
MRLATLLLLLPAPALLADEAEPKDPKAPVAREIKVTSGLPVRKGLLDKPTKITSAAELAKEVPNKDAQAAIAKQVDFKKEYLLLFAWSGSGGDRINFKVEKGKGGPEVVFAYTRGFTRDLRRHGKLFAVPNKTTYRMGK